MADGGRRELALGTVPSGAGGTEPAFADRHHGGSHAVGLRSGQDEVSAAVAGGH